MRKRYRCGSIGIAFVLASALALLAQSDRVQARDGAKMNDAGQPLLTASLGEAPAMVGDESELPDADEASRQNVLDKTAQKLRRFQSHLLLLVAMRVIFPAEGDALSIKRE